MENMSAVVYNVLECLTIEISMVDKKISSLAVYTEHLDQIWTCLKIRLREHLVITNHKIMFIGGDINIDLLNPNKHK